MYRGSSGNLDFSQAWREQSYENERKQINTGCEYEETAVTVRSLQNVSCVESYQSAADRTSHAADAYDRADGYAWKHIRYRSEEIGRPSLMRSCSDAKQANRSPLGMQVPDGKDGHDEAGTNEHRDEARSGR